MPTMNEVARRAGISVSAVSCALRGTRAISDQTRACLSQGMAELDYQPNARARGLAGGQSRVLDLADPPLNRTIGTPDLIFIFVDIDFRPTVLRGVDYTRQSAGRTRPRPAHLGRSFIINNPRRCLCAN